MARRVEGGQAEANGVLPGGAADDASDGDRGALERAPERLGHALRDGDDDVRHAAVGQCVDGSTDEGDAVEFDQRLRQGGAEPGTRTGRHHNGDDRLIKL